MCNWKYGFADGVVMSILKHVMILVNILSCFTLPGTTRVHLVFDVLLLNITFMLINITRNLVSQYLLGYFICTG